MNFFHIILWLILGIFTSGITQKVKDHRWLPYVSRDFTWGVRIFKLLLCFFIAWLVSLRISWDWFAPFALYGFSEIGFTHIFHPLSKKGPNDVRVPN